MHHGYWMDGSNDGRWLFMVVVMAAFWAGIIWLIVTLIRHGSHRPQTSPSVSPAPPMKMSPQEVLADRLARGEIEPDDYRRRLDALNQRPGE